MSSKALGAFIGVWVCAGLVACSDDDDPKGPRDAAVDAAAVDAGSTFIPRRDAAVLPNDPIRACDRFDPNSCPAGQTCDVLVRLFAGSDRPVIYTGCVEPGRERGLGDPCDADITGTAPYQTKGLTDLVFRDPCGPGLICGADPKIRGGTSCQISCASGGYEERPVLCDDPDSWCVNGGQLREYCRAGDGCDVTRQTGCRPGNACYLRPRDNGNGFLSLCLPPASTLVADGEACGGRTNVCRPGSSCTASLRLPTSQWTSDAYACRPACTTDDTIPGGDGDAGQDDAGTASGACVSPAKCARFSDANLSIAAAQPPYGQCE